MVPEIELLVKHFAGRPWNPVTQREYMELLREQDFFAGDGSNDPAFSARDRINRAPKSLGFVRLQPVVGLTPAGEQLLKANNKGEVFLRQLLKFQIPSAYHQPTPQAARFHVKPYLELIRLVRTLGTLKFDELQIFGLQLYDYGQFDKIVGKILQFREQQKAHQGSYRQFKSTCLRAELERIYYDQISEGKTKTRESSDRSITNFLNTRARNMRDYADACFRYLRATGLVNVSYHGKSLSINPLRAEEVEFILNKIDREPCFINAPEDYIEYLESAHLPELLTDNLQQLEQKIRSEFPDLLIPENATIQQLKDIYSEALKRQKHAAIEIQVEQLKQYRDYANVQETFRQLSVGELYDAPLMLEWNMWRAMTMLDGGEIKANLTFDDYGRPLSTAAGNKADIVCDYGEFTLAVEVTLSSGNRQFEMEGESVLRHLGNLKKTTGKPCYCLFVAPKISSACISYFYTLHHVNLHSYGGQSTIVPLPLDVFRQMLEQSYKTDGVPAPDSVKALFKASQTIADKAADELEWYNQIRQFASHWLCSTI